MASDTHEYDDFIKKVNIDKYFNAHNEIFTRSDSEYNSEIHTNFSGLIWHNGEYSYLIPKKVINSKNGAHKLFNDMVKTILELDTSHDISPLEILDLFKNTLSKELDTVEKSIPVLPEDRSKVLSNTVPVGELFDYCIKLCNSGPIKEKNDLLNLNIDQNELETWVSKIKDLHLSEMNPKLIIQYELCNIFIYNVWINLKLIDVETSVFAMPFWWSFEKYVGKILESIVCQHCQVISGKRYPYLDDMPQGKGMCVIPDHVVKCHDTFYIFDAKAMPYTRNKCRLGIRQIDSYKDALGSKKAALIYPRYNGYNDQFKQVCYNNYMGVGILFLDMYDPIESMKILLEKMKIV